MVNSVILACAFSASIFITIITVLEYRNKNTTDVYLSIFAFFCALWCVSALLVYLFPLNVKAISVAPYLYTFSLIGAYFFSLMYIINVFAKDSKKYTAIKYILFAFTGVALINLFYLKISLSIIGENVFFIEEKNTAFKLHIMYRAFVLFIASVIALDILRTTHFKREKTRAVVILLVVIVAARTLFSHLNTESAQHVQILSVMAILILLFHASKLINKTQPKIDNVAKHLYYNVSKPILLLSVDEKIVLCNASASIFFNVGEKEVLGKIFSSFFALSEPLDISKTAPPHTEESIHAQGTCIANNMFCELDVTSIYDSYGEFIYSIVLINDVSDKIAFINRLKNMNEVTQKINDVACALMSIEFAEKFDQEIYKCLGMLGKFVSRSRAYIWRNHLNEAGKLCCSQVYEWSENAEPQINNPELQGLEYETFLPSFYELMKNKRSLNSPVRYLSQSERDVLEPQSIVSLLIAPIFINDNPWGFIGFDNCENEEIFSDFEENLLRVTGGLFASAILKNELNRELKIAHQNAVMASEAKSDFLANMSHEIRTPLNAVVGLSELCLREELTPVLKEHVFGIKQASTNLLLVINDILDLSKIEAGQLEIINHEYSLSAVLNEVITIIRVRLANKHILFTANVESRIPDKLCGDEVRIKQILINLLNNAVKFTHEGFVALNVTGKIENDSLCLFISVKDSGIGIKKEDQHLLFENFVQLDMKKNRNIEGSGLGLPIVKKLCALMQGSVWVESEYGKGSTFTVELPQQIVNNVRIAKVENAKQKNVLLYELHNTYAQSIEATLADLHVPYKRVQNFSAFTEAMHTQSFAFVFISDYLWHEFVDVIKSAKYNTQFVVLPEVHTSLTVSQDIKILTMPVYCVSTAKVLNNQNESAYTDEHEVKFTAPKARVLVVDDNNMNLLVAKGLLSPYQMTIDTCSSGKKAIKLIEKNTYDLIFMDHMMPEMDGAEAVQIIRSKESDYCKQVPIVAFTANVIRGVKEMLLENGFNDFLGKPIEMHKLASIVDKYIPQKYKVFDFYPKKKEIQETVSNAKKDFLPPITNVNQKIGLAHTGDSLEDYIKILRVFCSDGKSRLQELKQYNTAGDLSLFVINTHALKSTLATIGAQELAEKAKNLELSGKQDMRTQITDMLPQFISDFEALINEIQRVLPKEETATIPVSHLKECLEQLILALDTFDIKKINEVMNAADTNVEPLSAINTLILDGDYDKAKEIAIDFLEKSYE